jgi:DNA-directed RNA polymerase specialized sigma24 family protein
MIDVEAICAPKEGWTDTPEQAALRTCLVHALADRDPLDQVRIGRDLINLMRDQLMRAAADVRKAAALEARRELSPSEIAAGSDASGPTVSRLLSRAKEFPA